MFCLSRDDVAAIVVEQSCGAESLISESSSLESPVMRLIALFAGTQI